MADYIPRPDGEFTAWVANFVTYATAHLVDLGLVAGDLTPITAARTVFDPAYAAHTTAQTMAQSARQAKDDARDTLETALRTLVRRLQANPAVNDAERQALGLTVADDVRTLKAAAAATRPVGVIDTSERLRHTLRFYDEANPTRRARPEGAMGCEVWVKLDGAAPADAGECQFVALDTASPYVAEYDGKAGGKTAHYMLRWVNTQGGKGPWSETVSATIGA